MLELQRAVESRDETARELMQKLAESDNEQRSVKQETEQQTVQLTKQIKILQDQLLEVSEPSLEPRQLIHVYCIYSTLLKLATHCKRFHKLIAVIRKNC